MTSTKLSQAEADRLLNMIKRGLVPEMNFPSRGESTEFNVIGDSRQDVFAVRIYRGKINRLKYNMNARIVRNGVPLLELHINPSNQHTNPDGEKITGSHWHIYSEEYGRLWAFPAESLESDQFVGNTISFLERFHVVERPAIHLQLELI